MTPSTSSGPTTRVMIDIETLSIDPGGIILSVAAVEFTRSEIKEQFERSISIESCQQYGLGDFDPDTLEWWLDQPADVQTVLTGGSNVSKVLEEFARWYATIDPAEVWAYSPSFDLAHLEAAYDAIGDDAPWAYYEKRDARTLAELPVSTDTERTGTEHDALDDAIYQAKQVINILAAISE